MALFGKNKKQGDTPSENNPAQSPTACPDEKIVYRDGVFEVAENTASGKKYGRILKYHGGTRLLDISNEEFELWSDAGKNFNKYRITYERDEDFFIEKASIELALPDKHAPDVAASNSILDEAKRLSDFFENALSSADFGAELLENATIDECFSTAALCDKKISDLISKAKSSATSGQSVEVAVPQALAKLSENSKKAFYSPVMKLDKLYVIYSPHTKRQHSAAGNALITITKAAADEIIQELSNKNQQAYIKTVYEPHLEQELGLCISNGLEGVRFVKAVGLSTTIGLRDSRIKQTLPFPENIAVRKTMDAFFQDLNNGIPAEKLRASELAMYEAFFGATFLQPCARIKENGSEGIKLCILRDKNGNNMLDLHTSVETMEASEMCIRFKKENPDQNGYKKWSFDELVKLITSDDTQAHGFLVDKEYIPAPFNASFVKKLSEIKKVWEQNGNSFVKKQ